MHCLFAAHKWVKSRDLQGWFVQKASDIFYTKTNLVECLLYTQLSHCRSKSWVPWSLSIYKGIPWQKQHLNLSSHSIYTQNTSNHRGPQSCEMITNTIRKRPKNAWICVPVFIGLFEVKRCLRNSTVWVFFSDEKQMNFIHKSHKYLDPIYLPIYKVFHIFSVYILYTVKNVLI